MDSTPLFVLIRPDEQSKRLLEECEAAFGGPISALFSPIIRITPTNTPVDLSQYMGVIVTSVNGVRYAGDLRGKRLYCVGNRTKIAAEKAGAKVLWVAKTASALIDYLKGHRPDGPLVYLRGQHVAKNLNIPGIETDSVVVYDQSFEPIGPVLREAISADMPAVLPLYSRRSALLLGQGVEAVSACLHVIAISDAVAQAWRAETGGDCEVCNAPDGAEMIHRIVAALRA